MDRILLSTLVHRPPEEVFSHLTAFTEYTRYTDHLQSVTVHRTGAAVGEASGARTQAASERPGVATDGEGYGVGTQYDLNLTWWKLGYTARSEVTSITPPKSLEWQLVKDVDATGEWRVEPEPESAPEGVDTASRVYFSATYDPHTASADAISLPTFVSVEWVIKKVRPRLLGEAQTVVSRLVEAVEGQSREVELTVHEMP